MRTRLLDALTNDEITAYLRHNDLLSLPLGAVEMQGAMPVGSEYVLPLACGLEFAEQTDGLVLPHLAYFFSGAPAIGRGTVSVSPEHRARPASRKSPIHCVGRAFGGKYSSRARPPRPGHGLLGGAGGFPGNRLRGSAPRPAELRRALRRFQSALLGRLRILGRLERYPHGPEADRASGAAEAVHKMQRPGVQFGFYYSDETQHGWWPAEPVTAEQREARAQRPPPAPRHGRHGIEAKTLVEGIRELNKYVQHHVRPEYETRLP